MNKLKILMLTCFVSIASLACSSDQKQIPEPKTEKSKLTVITYNIHHGAPENSEVVNLENIANTIKQKNPDLVALQEVDVNVPRSGKVDQAKKLAELLNMNYYFSKSLDYNGGEYGVAILSKFPISNTRRLELPMPVAGEKRTVAMATIDLGNGKTLEFASTHLDLNVPNRTAQATFLNELSVQLNKPIMIGGDYNAESNSVELTELRKQYTLSCVNGCPNSFPVRNPTKAIDFIASNKLAVQQYSLLSAVALTGSYASDHLPVVAIYNY